MSYSKILMISPIRKWVNFLGKFTNAKGAETVGYSKILMISPIRKWVNFLGKFTNAKGAETVGRKLQTDVN